MNKRPENCHYLKLPTIGAAIVFILMMAVWCTPPLAAGVAGASPFGKPEKTIEKTLPIEIRYTGNPAFGYKVVQKSASPDRVVLRGPTSLLSPIDVIYTHTLDINGASEPVIREVALDLPENVDVLSLKPPVSATIVIEKQMTEKTFNAIPIHGANTQYSHIIRPAKIDITVQGAMLFFEETFHQDSIEVFVDLQGLEPGIYVKPAVIDLPEKVTLTDASPRIFTVEIKPGKKQIAEE